MNKAREIKIVETSSGNLVFFSGENCCFGDTVKIFREVIPEQEKEIEKLRRDNAIMKEALEFYANEMNYSVDDYWGGSGEMRKKCVLYSDCEERKDVYSYAGRRARESLEKIK